MALNTIQAITYTVARTRNPNLWMNQDIAFRKLGTVEEQAGERIQVPVRFSAHPVEHYKGLQPSQLAVQEWETTAFYEWIQQRVPMTYKRIDVLKNSGNKNSIINYITSLEQNADDSFADDMAEQFFGAVTDAAGTEFNSFQHIANDAANGLATGTTLGTLDKNVLVDGDGNKVWAGKVLSLAGAGHGPTMNNLLTGWFRVVDGNKQPKIAVAHPEVLGTIVKQAQLNMRRYVDNTTLTVGFTAYDLQGIPFYGQRHMPFSLTVPGTNRIYYIDTDTVKVVMHRDCNMIREPFTKLQGQDGWAGYKLVTGNTVCDDPRRNMVIHNFDYNQTTD